MSIRWAARIALSFLLCSCTAIRAEQDGDAPHRPPQLGRSLFHSIPTLLVVTLGVDDPGCNADCVVEAVVVPQEEESYGQFCVDNPYLQRFVGAGDIRIRGALAQARLSRSGREIVVLIQVTGSNDSDFIEGRVCAPHFLTAGTRLVSVEGADDLLGTDDLISQTGLSNLLFGYRSRSLVQVELQSTPTGAAIFLGETPTPYRTDRPISVPQRMLGTITLRLNHVQRPLRQCSISRGRGRSIAIFQCTMTN